MDDQEQAWDTHSSGLCPVMAQKVQSHHSSAGTVSAVRPTHPAQVESPSTDGQHRTLHSGTCGDLDLSLDPPARASAHDMRAPCRILYLDGGPRGTPGTAWTAEASPKGHLHESDSWETAPCHSTSDQGRRDTQAHRRGGLSTPRCSSFIQPTNIFEPLMGIRPQVASLGKPAERGTLMGRG